MATVNENSPAQSDPANSMLVDDATELVEMIASKNSSVNPQTTLTNRKSSLSIAVPASFFLNANYQMNSINQVNSSHRTKQADLFSKPNCNIFFSNLKLTRSVALFLANELIIFNDLSFIDSKND